MPSGARSRHGCAGCKTHRIKCDEVWPTCGRCSRLNMSCSGPMLRVRWSAKHQIRQPGRSNVAGSPQSRRPTTSSEGRAQELTGSYERDVNPGLLGLASATNSVDADTMRMAQCDLEQEDVRSAAFTSPGGSEAVPPDFFSHAILEAVPSDFTDESFPNFSAGSLASPSDLFDSGPLDPLDAPENATAQERLGSAASQLAVCRQPMNRTITDYDTILVEYYFKDTASVLALYDSNLNPFRTMVGRLWDSSELFYNVIQSMAAAHLANTYPQMATVAARFRENAMVSLRAVNPITLDEQTMLALFMVAGTASWFDVDATGVEDFLLMREYVRTMTESGRLASMGNNLRFFRDLVVCLEMFLAFVVDAEQLGPLSSSSLMDGSDGGFVVFPQIQMPHPVTGVACEVHGLLARVGRLLRMNRGRMRATGFTTRATIQALEKDLSEASELEHALRSLEIQADSDVAHTGDAQTPAWHLTTLAGVYRDVGLLQIYRVFPDIRSLRMDLEQLDPARNTGESSESSAAIDGEAWLRARALKIVRSLQSIPAESGTKDFQAFLLVATCSELTLPDIETTGSDETVFESIEPPPLLPPLEDIAVRQARAFMLDRLRTLQCSLPRKPIERCLDIIQATWREMDSARETPGTEAPFWMDVMSRNGWETFMA